MSSLLFDYGGTLDADGVAWRERFRPLYGEFGVNIPPDRFDRAFYDADDRLANRHALVGLDLESTVLLQTRDVLADIAPEFIDRAEAIAARFASESRQHFSRLRPTLERLGKSRKLGIVSNFYGNLDGLLRAEGLREMFGVVADSGALGAQKPDPAIFLHAARALSSRPQDCVMVGDSITRDIRGAAAAGMKSVLVCAHETAPTAGQDWTVTSVAQLEAALS